MAVGFVLWFTGLSGAGKSTLCAMVGAELTRRGVHVEVLDGDEVRRNLSKGLGYSKEDRDENVRRLGFVARLAARSGACAITAAISPYRAVREEVRALSPRFLEVYCKCPIAVLAERDPKGLYERALRGEIKNFTGVDDPYEEPENPEVLLYTDREEPAQSARRVVERLEQLGFIPGLDSSARASCASSPVEPHGGELQPRLLSASDEGALRKRARDFETVPIAGTALNALRDLATGCLSPLKGFMGRKDFRRVKSDRRLESGLFWPTPLLLPLPSDAVLSNASEVGLVDEAGELCGVLSVDEIWQDDAAGPGRFLAGDVKVIARPTRAFGLGSARESRERLSELEFARVVTYQVDAAASLADEHLLRAAIEFFDAVAVMPCGDGVRGENLAGHAHVLRHYFPAERALLLPALYSVHGQSLEAWMLRAIAAQNCGSARLLVPELVTDGGVLPALLEKSPAAELQIQFQSHAAPAFSPRLGAMVSRRTTPDQGVPSPHQSYREEVLALMAGVSGASSK